MAPGSRGVGAVFVHSSDADSGQTGDAIGEPRVPRRSRSHYLSNAPGLADQLVASRKDSAREGGCPGEKMRFAPSAFQDSRESELGLVRYGPASRVHRGVFGPFEGSFPIGIPADPDKFLAIREFHVVHGCVLFPMCPGSQINLLRVRKTLCASVATSALHRGEFGFARYDPANGGRRNVPYAKGVLALGPSCSGSERIFAQTLASQIGCFVNNTYQNLAKCRTGFFAVLATTLSFLTRFRPVKYGIEALDILYTLVKGVVSSIQFLVWSTVWSNLGQTWSTLVKLGRTWAKFSKLLEMYPGLHFKGFWARWVLVGLETARSNLGQTSVNPSQTWSTLVKLGQTLENVSRTFLLGVFEVMSPRRNRPTWFGLPRFATPIDDQFSPIRPTAANRKRIGLVHPGLETKFVIPGPNRSGPPSPRSGDELGTNRPGPSRSRNEICDSGLNRSGPPSPRNGDELGTNRPGPPRSRNEICDSGPNRSGPPSPRNGDELGTNRPGPPRSRNEICDSGPNRSGPPSPRNGDELGTNRPGPPRCLIEVAGVGAIAGPIALRKARLDLQAEFDAEAAGLAPSAARAPPRPGVVIGRSAGPSETTRPSPQPSVTTGSSDAPPVAPRRAHTRSTGILPSRLKRQRSEGIPDSAGTIPEDYVAPGFRYPPHGGIRPRYPVAVEISDTPLLTNLLAHPSSLVRRCQEPPYSAGRGGWSEFSRLLAASRPEYKEFLTELGFGPFLSIPYVSVYHPAVWCFIERFFHHTGTFHLSTCEMAVLPIDWSAILGIRFGGRAPPSEPIDGFEAREILGLADRDAIEGTRRPSVRIRHLADVLRRDREEPPTELRYRQWAAYFIFSCFLGNDRSIVPTPIVGMFRDIDTLREYDWGALTYGFYIRGLRRYSRRESISFLGFWQFTVFWAFEHFPTFAPSRLPLASDPDFPLARRWDTSRIERMTACTLLELRMTVDCLRDADIIFQPYSAALSQRPEVFRAVALSCLRLWIRTTRSWELLLGERTVRQLGDEAVVPVDPSPLMTIEDYIPRAPSDPYIAGVSAYPSLVREGVPYQEWFEQVSLGSLMSLHEVEGGRVMGGVAMDSHHIRSSGQIERLEGEILRLQLELSVSVDRHTAEMASMQTEATQREGEMVQMQRDLAQSQRDLGSRDAEVARLAAAVRRLEEQLQGMGITPVTGADLSGLGQPSSSPPRDPVSRDWFFDDPSPP
uniref:Aminotransferase-like plant mobile domain-containing protein n=1 Tax=Fagus sylvatica TaxID=28930 RepID=A0A2N9H5B0_FAGSY